MSLEKELIENLDQSNCPIEFTLKDKGCQSDYEGTKLTLVGSIISFASTEVTGGQISDVCVVATNNAGSIHREIQLIQQEQSKCVDSLTLKQKATNEIIYEDSSKIANAKFDFFVNS